MIARKEEQEKHRKKENWKNEIRKVGKDATATSNNYFLNHQVTTFTNYSDNII